MNNSWIRIFSEWPVDDPDAVFFSLSLELGGRAGLSPAREPESPQAEVLRHIARLLLNFAAEAFRLGYQARVDAASDIASDGTWPRWCSTLEQLSSLVISVLRDSASQHFRIYPVSVWLLPNGNLDTDARIDSFRVDRFNRELYREIISSGVVRIMLDHPFCDIVADRHIAERVLAWMQAAVESTAETDVRWDLTPY